MQSDNLDRRVKTLEEENRRLRVAVGELSVLNDIATAVTSTQSVEKIVDLIVQKCVKHLSVEQGAVMLLDEKDLDNPFHTMVRKQDSLSQVLPYRLDTQLTGWMMKNKAPLLINDFKTDKRFNWFGEEEIPIHSLLSVPLLLKGKMLGLVVVFNKRGNLGFSESDQRMLAIIAAQSAHVIENARLYQEEQALLRFQEEMRLAEDIQINLLPREMPQIPGYEIAGISVPAKEVGGDYFDFISLKDNRLAFCLGDVSGKGMPAAMLMANLQATLRGQTQPDVDCKDCISKSNHLLYQSTDSRKFATLFYGILDFKNHNLTYCNAGHDNPYLFGDGETPERLATGGVVLGFVPEFDYAQSTVNLNPGHTLVIYSDGITEAMNAREEEFGEERLSGIIAKEKNKPAKEMAQTIFNEIDIHVGDEPQMDDKTIVILKRVD